MSFNASMLKAMRDEGLSLDACIRVLEAGEAAEPKRSSAAVRQARYRVNKRNECDVTGDVTPPLKDKLKTPSSEANASGGEPPADPLKQVFDLGVALLTDAGKTESQARSLIGKWRKAIGKDGEVLTGIIECRARSISEPVEWLEKRFKSAKYVSATGYEYRGSDEQIMREAERRNDMDTYWKLRGKIAA